MWKLGLCLLATSCYLIQVKATSDISLDDLLERLVVLEDWKRVAETKVAEQEITIQNLQRDLAAQNNLTAELLQHCQQDKRQDVSSDEETGADDNDKNKHTSGDGMKTTEGSEVNFGKSKMVKREIAGGIAFTAYLDHDVNPGPKQTIIFNQIITNDGSGYDNNTGMFTCPEAGLYMFTFFISQRSEHDTTSQLWAELVLNNHVVAGAVAETRHRYEDAQGGNTVVVRLNNGDTVWVDAEGSGYHVEGDSYRLTTFSGMYLYF